MRAGCDRRRKAAAETSGRASAAAAAEAPEAVRALLLGSIDYAGLFPPAGLSMTQAVANYARYRAGRHAWALGRFVVPVARLDEFMVAFAAQSAPGRWALGALAGGTSPATDLVKAAAFNEHYRERARIDSLELGADATLSIAEAVQLADGRFATFHEIPLAQDFRERLTILVGAGGRAKIRAGGITPEAFPEVADVARFLWEANTVRVRFKATAGLHHAIRGMHRLTGESNSPAAVMHGFVNVLLAAAFARAGWDAGRLAEVLAEQSPTAFQLEPQGLSWRGHRLALRALKATRSEFLTSFGSCSFEEPIADLEALGWLPA